MEATQTEQEEQERRQSTPEERNKVWNGGKQELRGRRATNFNTISPKPTMSITMLLEISLDL